MVGISLAAPTAYADNLLDVVAAALTEDPTFAAAGHALAAERESLPQARSRLLPEITYEFRNTDTDQDIVRSDNTVFALGSDRFDSDNSGLRVSQSIFDRERRSRLRQSVATVSRAEADFLDARHALYLRAAEAYFSVLEQLNQLQTISDEKTALGGHRELARRRAESGMGRQVDVQDAEARYLTAVAKEIEVQSALADARNALSILTGALPGELDPLRSDLALEPPAPADPNEWVRLAAERNPLIDSRRHALEEAREELRARQSKRYPTLDLVVSEGNEVTGGSLFGGGSEVDTGEITLELKVPVFHGGFVSSRVRQALSEERRAAELLKEAERNSEREVRDAYQRVVGSIAQVAALTQSVAAQRRTLDLKTSGFGSGTYSILEVLDAQQDLSRVQQSETKARYDYALNTLRLKRAAGLLSERDIEVVNGWLLPAGGN